jgi:hypothetical protein
VPFCLERTEQPVIASLLGVDGSARSLDLVAPLVIVQESRSLTTLRPIVVELWNHAD